MRAVACFGVAYSRIFWLFMKGYGNTGSGVFKRGGTKLERFLPKNQHTQGKLLDFENWVNETRSKRAKIWLSKSVFYLKNHSNLSKFFVIEDCHNEGEIWCLCTPLTKRVQNWIMDLSTACNITVFKFTFVHFLIQIR